jgi:choline dehydrogenase-like flavoprotein
MMVARSRLGTAFRLVLGRWVPKDGGRLHCKVPIRFNYMSHPDDWAEMRVCVRLTRKIFQQPAFAPWRGREIQPGADCISDGAIEALSPIRSKARYIPAAPVKWVIRTTQWPWLTPRP